MLLRKKKKRIKQRIRLFLNHNIYEKIINALGLLNRMIMWQIIVIIFKCYLFKVGLSPS